MKGTNGSLQKGGCYLRLNLLLDAQLVAIDRIYQLQRNFGVANIYN